jgi:signal transduction protein with GAF and PtsI domain
MDDVRPQTLRKLRLQAEGLCRERAGDLQALAQRLLASGPVPRQQAA